MSNDVPGKNILISAKTLTKNAECGKKNTPGGSGGHIMNPPLTHIGKNLCG